MQGSVMLPRCRPAAQPEHSVSLGDACMFSVLEQSLDQALDYAENTYLRIPSTHTVLHGKVHENQTNTSRFYWFD